MKMGIKENYETSTDIGPTDLTVINFVMAQYFELKSKEVSDDFYDTWRLPIDALTDDISRLKRVFRQIEYTQKRKIPRKVLESWKISEENIMERCKLYDIKYEPFSRALIDQIKIALKRMDTERVDFLLQNIPNNELVSILDSIFDNDWISYYDFRNDYDDFHDFDDETYDDKIRYIIHYLVEKGASDAGKRDIMFAILRENLEESTILSIIKYLAEKGVDLHADNERLLRKVIAYRLNRIFKYLVDNSADIHANDDAAFIDAAISGNLDIVKYLVQHGADVNANNHRALLYAINWQCLDNDYDCKIVEYFLNNGVNIDDALINAIKEGYLTAVKYLVEKGATIYDDALRIAIAKQHKDIVEYPKSKRISITDSLAEGDNLPTDDIEFIDSSSTRMDVDEIKDKTFFL